MTDRATDYANAVLSGDILAGPHVRNACRRHLSDLERMPDLWRIDEASEAIAFFEEVLCLNGGQFEGKPFLLHPWQCFIVGSLFGWKRADGSRRFRVAYIETAKGSGKSPIAAGIGLKGLMADKEPRAEIYAAATHKDQAKILFRDALAMFDSSPELSARLIASGTGDNRWNLAYTSNGSFFRVISSENKGKSGPRPHICLLDEIHEHPNRDVIEMLRAGFKFRRQPLSVMITNSGHDKTTVCWEFHEMGEKVCSGAIENDEFFAYICSLDDDDLKDDRYLTDEACWIKANPSLPVIPGYDYIRSQVNEAMGMPGKMATVKRLNFCVWTEAETPWISGEVWNGCKGDFTLDEMAGRRCYGGLDLSATKDLTALSLVFEPTEDDPLYRLITMFWTPGGTVRVKSKEDRVPYDVWRDQGHIFAPPGNSIDKRHVVREIAKVAETVNLAGIAYDRKMIEDLFRAAEDEGVELSHGKWDKERKEWVFEGDGIRIMPFGQEAASMHPALEKLEGWLVNGRVRHNGNPCLTWNAACSVVEVTDVYRRIAKRRSTGRVDGIVAACMAAGVAGSIPEDSGRSVYETRGVRVI